MFGHGSRPRTLFAVSAPPPRPSGNLLSFPIHGKLGVGLTATPGDDESDQDLAKVIEKIPELGGTYSVDDPQEMFDFMREVKKEVKPIDYLVIGGHGSGGDPTKRHPVIELPGESLSPEDATVILLNCSTLGTPEGRKFAANLGRVLLSKRGGVLIASRTDVQYGIATVGETVLNTVLLGTPTFFRNLYYWAKGDISWDDFKWVYDAPAGQGFVKGQFEAIKIPAEP